MNVSLRFITLLLCGCVAALVKSTSVHDVAFTYINACASSTDGDTKCWGETRNLGIGRSGALNSVFGDEPNEMGVLLPKVNLGTGRTVQELARGLSLLHMCALLDGGDIKCWGLANTGALGGASGRIGDSPSEMGDALDPVDLGSGRSAVQVAIGYFHTCAVLDNGELKCWGLADDGRLGRPYASSVGTIPEEMGDNLLPVNLGIGRTALQVACGQMHTCAILDNHQVKCWGRGLNGQLGNGESGNVGESLTQMGDNLKEVDLGTGRTALQIDCGYSHTCVLLDNYQVKCWGEGTSGQLGNGANVRIGDSEFEMGDNLTEVNLGKNLSALEVAAGSLHTCILLSTHQVKCFGSGFRGQLGLETALAVGYRPYEMGDNLTAVDVGENRSVVAIRTGISRTCAILDNGTLKCWGDNDGGELGYGDTLPRGGVADSMGDELKAVNLSFGIEPPSKSPTPGPTDSPSTTPTPEPTSAPSTRPSPAPSGSPTSTPTAAPQLPSVSPTPLPSISPSVAPTFTLAPSPAAPSSSAPTSLRSDNTEGQAVEVGIGIAVFAFIVMAVYTSKNGHCAKDTASLEEENVRYQGSQRPSSRGGGEARGQPRESSRYTENRAPRFAVAITQEQIVGVPVAKEVTP